MVDQDESSNVTGPTSKKHAVRFSQKGNAPYVLCTVLYFIIARVVVQICTF